MPDRYVKAVPTPNADLHPDAMPGWVLLPCGHWDETFYVQMAPVHRGHCLDCAFAHWDAERARRN